jgi:hypothetical protein
LNRRIHSYSFKRYQPETHAVKPARAREISSTDSERSA